MTTVEKMLIDLDPETMVRQVMSDPNHKARVRARTERERKASQTKTEKALQAEKAGRKTDRERFLRHYTRLKVDGYATATAAAILALWAGYCLAFV